jgi:hypothetical protein
MLQNDNSCARLHWRSYQVEWAVLRCGVEQSGSSSGS